MAWDVVINNVIVCLVQCCGNGMGCFVQDDKATECFVQGVRNGMQAFIEDCRNSMWCFKG